MIVTFSALVSEASGSVGPVVFSRWKGIPYVRSRITPANPKSTDQVTVREAFATTVDWWHDIEEQLQDFIKTLVTGRPLSGFNRFVGANCDALHDEDPPPFVPQETTTPEITTFAAVTGTGLGELDLTWDQANASETAKMYFLRGLHDADFGYPLRLLLAEKDTTLASAEALTIDVGSPGQDVGVFAIAEEPADSEFSIAAYAHAVTYTE